MWKLDRLNDLSRRICATQPSFAVIDQEYEKILKGPTYSPAVQCGIYATILEPIDYEQEVCEETAGRFDAPRKEE